MQFTKWNGHFNNHYLGIIKRQDGVLEYTGALDCILKYEWEMDGDMEREVLVRDWGREKDSIALGPVSSM